MKKTLVTLALILTATTATAAEYNGVEGSYNSLYEVCMNEQRQNGFYAGELSMKAHCDDHVKTDKQVAWKKEQEQLMRQGESKILAIQEELLQANIALAKSLTRNDRVCKARIGGRDGSFIQCTDSAGTFILN